MAREKTGSRSFGMFTGVFVPTFLSIIGVILFLRLGYIVGEVGLLGTIIIILLAMSVSITTGLALSSIVSNIRIGAGGAYSIVTKTLGLEIGGSIGIPLYLAQTFSVALYLFGFAEAWTFFFPGHPIHLVAIAVFWVLFLIVFISTKVAVRVQLGVFVLICIALASIFLGGNAVGAGLGANMRATGEISFWTLFAIFFPAVTGLMSGIGMSGELTNPKKQIPRGVIYSLLVTTLIYIGTAIWLALSVPRELLLTDTLSIASIAISPSLVMVGILAATFSSGLIMIIAAPRVIQAMGKDFSSLPLSKFFTEKTEKGEPRNAVLVTGAIVAVAILLGTLDRVAQVLTMFFLITYVMINISVFTEQHLGLRSFRPTFKVPKLIPLYGAVASFVLMFLVNPYAALVALVFIVAVYTVLARVPLEESQGDVRSGLFRSVSEWAAQKTRSLPESTGHIWKPNVLIPVSSTRTLTGNFPLLKSIIKPHGTMTVLGFRMKKNLEETPEEDITEEKMEEELKNLPNLVDKFSEEGIFTSYSTINVENYINAIVVSLGAIDSQVFAPNILFLPYKPQDLHKDDLKKIVNTSKENYSGLALFDRDREVGLGTEEDIHVWISPKVLEKDLFEYRYYDLSLLIAYSVKENWDGNIHLWMCVDEEQEKEARNYLKHMLYEARFPRSTEINVVNGGFEETLEKAPDGDVHIIPFEPDDLDSISEIANKEGKSYLFVLDSTKESVLA